MMIKHSMNEFSTRPIGPITLEANCFPKHYLLVTVPWLKIPCLMHSFLCRLQVMPGFITSILQYESNVLLSCDVSHKILRSDTVLDIMYDLYSRVGGDRFHDEACRKLVGSIILTK